MRRILFVSYQEWLTMTPEILDKWQILIDYTRGGKWGDCNYGFEDYQKDYDEMINGDMYR